MAAVARPDMPPAPGDFLRREEAIAARRIMINTGILLVSAAAGSVITNTAAGGRGPAYRLVISFLIFLLGVSALTLGLAADQFPGAVRVSVAVVGALNHCLFGGVN